MAGILMDGSGFVTTNGSRGAVQPAKSVKLASKVKIPPPARFISAKRPTSVSAQTRGNLDDGSECTATRKRAGEIEGGHSDCTREESRHAALFASRDPSRVRSG